MDSGQRPHGKREYEIYHKEKMNGGVQPGAKTISQHERDAHIGADGETQAGEAEVDPKIG